MVWGHSRDVPVHFEPFRVAILPFSIFPVSFWALELKTGKGEYGEGDVFVGVRVPDLRKIAKQFSSIEFSEIKKLFQSKIHEERMLAILILTQNFRKSKDKKERKNILEFFLKNIDFVNNWDLVDVSVPYILGESILEKNLEIKILENFLKSESLWKRRIAIISTFAFIRQEKFSPTIKFAKKLLNDKEDLIHKAVGWMLREAWKKSEIGEQKCEAFLLQNYSKIPRTTLRYAIEKMPEKKRQKFLKGNF